MIGINHDVAPSSSRRAVALFIQVTSDDWTLHPLRLAVAVRLPAKGKELRVTYLSEKNCIMHSSRSSSLRFRTGLLVLSATLRET